MGYWENGSYGEPYELWDGHFSKCNEDGGALPIEEEDFKQFFVRAKERILARGRRIAEVLVNGNRIHD